MDTSDSQNKFVLDTTGKTRRSLPKLPDSQWFHVFFIYKTILPDKEIVAKLILHLEDLGYICGNHQKDFAVGKTILRNVQDCLQKSLTLVILLSKEFCKSKWCEYDLHVAQQLKINKGTKLQIIPLVLDDCDIPDLISHITYLEIDTKNIDAWYGRFLQSVDESMNLDNPIVQSSSSSSICQICERYIESVTNEEDKDQEDIQLDEEVAKYSENMLPNTNCCIDDELPKSECHVKYPEYMLIQKRLSSFDLNWTSQGLPEPRIMAVNGFFLCDNGYSARCFQCGISLYNWSPEDDPVFEHARWSPKCPYIIAKEGKKYIDLVAEAVREVEVEEMINKSLHSNFQTIEQAREKLPNLSDFPSSLVSSPVKWELLSPQRSLSSSLESLENCILSPRKSIYELIFQANGFEDLRADSGFLSSAFGSTESLDCQSTRTVRLPRYPKD